MPEQALKAVLSKPVRILGISGSLRQASFNTGLLRYIATNTPSNVEFSIADLRDVPLFNQDIEDSKDESKNPKAVQLLRKQIQASDALIFATSEYNYSMSGVLKNSIDWASRGPNGNSFERKTAAIIGAGGGRGTTRSQMALRQSAVFLDLLLLNKPEIGIQAFTPGVFNFENGDLLDEEWKEKIIAQVEALRDWTYKVKLGECAFEALKGK